MSFSVSVFDDMAISNVKSYDDVVKYCKDNKIDINLLIPHIIAWLLERDLDYSDVQFAVKKINKLICKHCGEPI